MTMLMLTWKMGMLKDYSPLIGRSAIWPTPWSSHGTRLRLPQSASTHTRTVSVAAINHGTSYQGKLVTQGSALVDKVTAVSGERAEFKGPESESVDSNGNTNSNSAPLSSKDSVGPEEQAESGSVGSKKLSEQLTDLRDWWKAVNKSYQEESATWGYGSRPIFTVYLGPEDQIERVSVDENEIRRRQVADHFIPGLDNDANAEHARQKIMLARSIAKDLERGKSDFNRHSTVFAVVEHVSKDKSQIGHRKLLKQIDVVVNKVAPALKWTLAIAIPLYGLSILFGAYLITTKRSEADLSKEEESAARLEKMRNLKAQMNSHKGNTSAEQTPLAPSEFMQKIFKVREMARKVRSEEGMQKSDSEIHVEEYQPGESGSLFSPTLSAESITGTQQEQEFHMDMEEYLQRVGVQGVSDTTDEDRAILDDVDPTESIINVTPTDTEEYQPKVGVQGMSDTTDGNRAFLGDVDATGSPINVSPKPACKGRPRIITSIDEAMAVLETKQTNYAGMAERVVSDTEPQSEHSINNAANLHDKTLPSADVDSMVRELGRSVEKSEMESDRILAVNSQEQDRVREDSSKERYEGPDTVDFRHDKRHTGTQHDIASKMQSIDVQTLEFRERNGRWDESQVLATTTDSQMESHGHDKNMHQFDAVAAKKVSATGFEQVRRRKSRSNHVMNMKTDEVVGSGQPLLKKAGSRRHGPIFSNTKQWSKELQQKYNSERDPEVRELMKEIGSELDSWLTEEEIEETARLVEKLDEGDDEYVQRNFNRVQRKIKEEKEKFGLDAVLEKYKEFQPKAADELWWLDLRCVLCLLVATQEGEGLYGLDMTLDDDDNTKSQVARHVIAFEDRKDVSSFCRLLELRSDSRFQVAEVEPYSPKELLQICKEEGFKVTVLRSGQIEIHVDQTLEEVEEKILEIGRSVYLDELEREHSVDVDSILHQRFGL